MSDIALPRVGPRENGEGAVNGKNWVWNAVGKKERSMRSETFAPRAAPSEEPRPSEVPEAARGEEPDQATCFI